MKLKMNQNDILLAPNGQPSNLTPTQYKLVRTTEFKAWFGDWEHDPKNASKVVDFNGEPLVVYHGSDKQFTTFKNSDVGELGLGVYFSADKEVGERYKFKNSYSNTSKVYECFLNVKKPYLLSDDTDDLYSEFMEVFLEDYNLRGSVKADRIATETLLKKHDSCISQKRKMFVVYKPNQIKLADGTNTTFDTMNPDIRFENGGLINFSKEEIRKYAENILKNFDYEYVGYSDTNGHSMYFRVGDVKIRFSDHSVTNIDRMNNEVHFNLWDGKKAGTPYGDFVISQKILMLKYDLGDKNIIYHKRPMIMPSGKTLNAFGYSDKSDISFKEGGSVSTSLLAPNGQLTNLTTEQYNLVRTPEFKAWFGDWEHDPQNASKVVDYNGEPLVVYHGTTKTFTIFDKNKINNSTGFGDFGAGFYFTSSYGTAKYYTLKTSIVDERIILNSFMNIRKPFRLKLEWENLSKESVDNYKKLKGLLPFQKEIIQSGLLETNRPSKYISKGLGDYVFQDILKTNGYDGVITDRINIYEKEDANHENQIQLFNEIVAFEPNQIKLADGKNTTFDMNNPDIRFKVGGTVPTTLLAPNGQPSNLTPEQYKLVRSPEFKAWFGDWEHDPKNASKVVDSNGEPLVVYHGSDNDFNVFSYNYSATNTGSYGFLGRGFYFATNKADASNYGKNVKSFFLKSLKKLDLKTLNYREVAFKLPKLVMRNGQNWKDAFIEKENIKNQVQSIEIEDLKNGFFNVHYQYNDKWETISRRTIYEIENDKGLSNIVNRIIDEDPDNIGAIGNYFNPTILSQEIKNEGFDSVISSGTNIFDLGDEIVVFEPNRIKLADGTNTTFDTMNPDIRFEDGGNIYTNLLAPNGQPSNLTPEQYKLVRSPEFKAWFGEWENLAKTKINDSGIDDVTLKRLADNVSKVIDNNGEPLVLFHGSDSVFNEFQIPEIAGVMGRGVYLTTDLSMAKFYGKNVYTLFANIKNPKKVNTREEDTQMLGSTLIYLKSKGKPTFDGVINQDGIWLALYPNQIKLADGTNTTFDMENNDIRFDKGGNIDINAPFDVNGKNLAVRVRQLVKELYPDYKWSITSTSSDRLDVYLLEADFDPFTDLWKNEYPNRKKEYNVTDSNFESYNRQESRAKITDRAVEVFKPIREYINKYIKNYNANDPYADHVDYNVYEYTYIGKWDKPYVQVEPKNKTKKSTATKSVPEPKAISTVPNSVPTTKPSNAFKPLQEKIVGYYLHSFYDGKVDEKFEITELISTKGDKFTYQLYNIETNQTTTQSFNKEDLAELFKMEEYEGYLLVPNDNYVEPIKPQPSLVLSAPVVQPTTTTIPTVSNQTNTKPTVNQSNAFKPLQEKIVGYYLHSFYDGKVDEKFEITELISTKGDKFTYQLYNIETNQTTTQSFNKEDLAELFKMEEYEGYLLVPSEDVDDPSKPKVSEPIVSLPEEGKFYCLNNESSYIQVTVSTPEIISYDFYDFEDADKKTLIEESDTNFINLFIETWKECSKPKYKRDDLLKDEELPEALKVIDRQWNIKNKWEYRLSDGSWLFEDSLKLFTNTKESIEPENIYAGLNSAVYFQITSITPSEINYKNYGKQNEFVSNGLMKTSDYTYKNFDKDYFLVDKPKYQIDSKVNLKDGLYGVLVLNRKIEKLSSGRTSWMYLIDNDYGWTSESEIEPILPKVGDVFTDGSGYSIITEVSKEKIVTDQYSFKNNKFQQEEFLGEENVNNFATIFNQCTIPKFIDGQEVIINGTNQKSNISYRLWSEDEKVWDYELTDRKLDTKNENELSSVETKSNKNLPKEGDVYTTEDNSAYYIIKGERDGKFDFDMFNGKNENKGSDRAFLQDDSLFLLKTRDKMLKSTIPKFIIGEEVLEIETTQALVIKSRSWNASLQRWVYMFELEPSKTAYEYELSSLKPKEPELPQAGDFYANLNSNNFYILSKVYDNRFDYNQFDGKDELGKEATGGINKGIPSTIRGVIYKTKVPRFKIGDKVTYGTETVEMEVIDRKIRKTNSGTYVWEYKTDISSKNTAPYDFIQGEELNFVNNSAPTTEPNELPKVGDVYGLNQDSGFMVIDLIEDKTIYFTMYDVNDKDVYSDKHPIDEYQQKIETGIYIKTTKPKFKAGDEVRGLKLLQRKLEQDEDGIFKWKYLDSEGDWMWEHGFGQVNLVPEPTEISIEEYFLNNFDSAKEIPRKVQVMTAIMMFTKSAVDLKDVAPALEIEKYKSLAELIKQKL
jgi:hypothetical protein